MKQVCKVCKYHGKWAVFLFETRTFEYIGMGKKKCEELARYLNSAEA